MRDYAQWRLEEYMDETDPFVAPQYYVMHGNLMIAHCEVQAHAAQIVAENQRLERYERVLQHIAAMTSSAHALESAVAAAAGALDEADHG